MSKKNIKKNKPRKEFKKVSLVMKMLLKKLLNVHGIEITLKLIDGMKEPTDNEKLLMKEYVINLNNDSAER